MQQDFEAAEKIAPTPATLRFIVQSVSLDKDQLKETLWAVADQLEALERGNAQLIQIAQQYQASMQEWQAEREQMHDLIARLQNTEMPDTFGPEDDQPDFEQQWGKPQPDLGDMVEDGRQTILQAEGAERYMEQAQEAMAQQEADREAGVDEDIEPTAEARDAEEDEA